MKKEKWMIEEIASWQRLALVDDETAIKLKERYLAKKNTGLITILFSVIGALLIGAGVILIGARNWALFPFPLRVGIAFLPLIVSQALAVYTVNRKYHSLAWRESVAILVAASVFAANALVGQLYHLPGDFGEYLLACGLLSLPMLYILDAASPLIVYYWAILHWAALESALADTAVLLGLFAIGALFVYLRREEKGARAAYMAWVTAAAGFALTLVMGAMWETSLLLAALCYFVLLLSLTERLPEQFFTPFRFAGVAGGFAVTAILTYEDMWMSWGDWATAGGGVIVGSMLAAALFFTARIYRRDKLKFFFILSLLLLCVLRLIWAMYPVNEPQSAFAPVVISNFVMFAIGVGFIMYGVKHMALLQTNIGMTAICALIVMRFFDSDMDFLWRGVVFVLAGTAFFLVNARILHTKKRAGREGAI